MFRITLPVMGLTALAVAAPLGAQSAQWLGPSDGKAIWVEMIRPDIDFDDVGFFTTAWQAGVRVPVGERLAVVAELPFAHADIDLSDDDETGTTGFGNPYLGVEFGRKAGCLRGEVGARVPLAPDDNAGMAVGLLGDFVDRAEAFAQDFVPITVGATHACPAGESGWSARFRGAGSIWIPTGDGDTEAMALYGIQAWYERDLVIGAGVTGRAILSEDGDFAERTFHQLGAAIGYDLGVARPMVELRVPLDEEVREDIPYTIGIGLVVRP
jgi:hypothetical protein